MKTILLFCAFIGIVCASELKICDEDANVLLRTRDPLEIAQQLWLIGVRFEQWEASQPIDDTATEAEIQAAYRADIQKIVLEHGFRAVDVIHMIPPHPNQEAIRKKFLNEHIHDEPEVRFFVEGSGVFFLHYGDRVYAVTCEKGDLMSIPPNYKHFFDMGPNPYFTAIRFFTRTEGWIPYFTGDLISQKFVTDGSL
ncbi:MAG: cupin [Verrucomicrobia bacterium]|nr:cupin [Verrucomicrobiota bacterium]MBU6446978.1 cupin [Verrucomicrobiota bacterium]MDE3047935.1 cupin [Verrucomicrobiota bacterium]